MSVNASTACVGSVLFTDLVGFTEFNEAAGDARAVEVLDRQTQLASQAVAGHPGGRLVKELGDAPVSSSCPTGQSGRCPMRVGSNGQQWARRG